jgi:hypothetical protein
VDEFNTLDPLVSLTALVQMEFGLDGSAGITGNITGIFTAFATGSSTGLTGSVRPFSLARGGSCLS